MQLYYQGKLSMEDYMQATLAPLTGLSVQTVAGWVQRYIRRDILPRVYPPPVNACSGTASAATASW